jgi:hypothetical protein
MDRPTCPSKDIVTLHASSSSSSSSKAVSSQAPLPDLEWSDEEEQDCLQCRMAGDSYIEISAQLIRLQHPARSVPSITSKLEELEKGDVHTLRAHLKGFRWKQNVADVQTHLEKRRKSEHSSSQEITDEKPIPRSRKRARDSTPPPPSISRPKRARTTAQIQPKIKQEVLDESDIEEISPIAIQDQSPRAVSQLTVPSPSTLPTTPRTWRSVGKQRELRPMIREQTPGGRAYHDFTLFERAGAYPTTELDTYTTATTTGGSSVPQPSLIAEDSGNLDGDGNVNWADYVSEDAWWQPQSLFLSACDY